MHRGGVPIHSPRRGICPVGAIGNRIRWCESTRKLDPPSFVLPCRRQSFLNHSARASSSTEHPLSTTTITPATQHRHPFYTNLVLLLHDMCDYTKRTYQCGHVRFVVKAWCVRYQQTHERCPPNVVATFVITKSFFSPSPSHLPPRSSYVGPLADGTSW